MKHNMFIKCILLFLTYANAAIIPEELPSLLSVAYSNIPPIKKGTDSRVGFGFSLGNHADFQVLFELGPQTNTNPIGTPYASGSKRQVNNRPKKTTPLRNKAVETDAGKYLEGWSQNQKQKRVNKPYAPLPIPEKLNQDSPLGTVNLHEVLANMKGESMEGEIVLSQPQPSSMPAAVLSQLKQLYGEKLPEAPSTERPYFIPKRNRVPTQHPAQTPKVIQAGSPNFERLAQFNIQEDEKSEAEKRKITAELSDVSLDDE